MALQLLSRGPRGIEGSPRERALAGFAALMTEAPWTVTADDFDRLRSVGLDHEGLVQTACIGAFFNYVTRVADATGIEFDYQSPLPRMTPDHGREPLPRPPLEAWPRENAAPRLSLSLRPFAQAAIARWRDFLFGRSAPLSARDRAVLARTAAFHTCDAAGVDAHANATPNTEHESALASFAEKLTLAPWTCTKEDIDALRALALDDRAILDVIGTVAFTNLESRLRVVLGQS